MREVAWSRTILAVALGLALSTAAGAADSKGSLAAVDMGATTISFQPLGSFGGMTLTVSGPGDTYVQQDFAAGVSPAIDLIGAPDGGYVYELRAIPLLDDRTRAEMAAARESGDTAVVEALKQAGLIPSQDLVQSGSFRIHEGRIATPAAAEPDAAGASGASMESAATPRDQVIVDDLIVDGSLCVGLDCVNGENFGFDTIRLKENNTRIKFEDTSVGTFPSQDWQITANDSANGGANKFSIDAISPTANTPFTIIAGAPSHSLFVSSSGNVGMGTSTPVLDAHIATGNTPALRLEQNSSSGFTAQTWDVAGNEANFFIRDVTGGSKLSFRIRPGAPSSSIDIAASGNVGIGTGAPINSLHVLRSDATATILVEDTNTGTADQTFLKLDAAGDRKVRYVLENSTGTWFVSVEPGGNQYAVSKAGTGVNELVLDGNGDMVIQGMLTQLSDFKAKANITTIDPNTILQRVAALPISNWEYKNDEPGNRHIGPMAQDFHAAFGLGSDDRHLAPSDVSGVALAAIQGLHQMVEEKDARIEQLEARLALLEAKLAAQPTPGAAE